jgi:hypothetical protein
MQLNADRGQGSDLKVDIFDFGGQEVFAAIHHLFMRKHSVYAVLFNMVDLSTTATAEEREASLEDIGHWLTSIAIHTTDGGEGGDDDVRMTATVVLVGTRKDKLPDSRDQAEISQLLASRFQHHPCWRRLLTCSAGEGRNGRAALWFFPIDNTIGREDLVLGELMAALEESLLASPFVQQMKPITWLRVLDILKKRCSDRSPTEPGGGKVGGDTQPPPESMSLSLQEMTSLAVANGIPEPELPLLLQFLEEIGVTLWRDGGDGSNLRNTIILNPTRYFVEPVTRIICRLNSLGNLAVVLS